MQMLVLFEVLQIYIVFKVIREELNIGKLPTFKLHIIGTFSMFNLHSVGTLPYFLILLSPMWPTFVQLQKYRNFVYWSSIAK